MAKSTFQIGTTGTTPDELKAQQQLARIVSEVVRELENGTTQAMLKVCVQESGPR